MAKKPECYTHEDSKRKNNPDAGLVPYDEKKIKKQKYNYDPHLDPELIWTRKYERNIFEVPIVSLTTQEVIYPKHIIEKLMKDNKSTLDRFMNQLPIEKKIEFYKHEIDWSNRLILGDSLLIMNSLLYKEGMEGKIQMIYIDPPYGIGYNSNFQVESNKRDVKDGQDDSLTREPEQIKAFRDTWELGIHSYLSYLRERLLLSKLLLKEEGSIFVQINDDNLHYIIQLMHEIFGSENLVSIIPFKKTTGKPSKYISSICDYIVWFAKNKNKMKFHAIFRKKEINQDIMKTYTMVEDENGIRRSLTKEEKMTGKIPTNTRLFMTQPLHSQGYSPTRSVQYEYKNKKYNVPKNRSWSISQEGLSNLEKKNRVYETDENLRFISYFDDYPIEKITNFWYDTYNESNPIYVVQTNAKVIQRCMIMTTDPGDIVFDPTCGSGTTAWVAENWGRRWITCDTSRIAINIAKQRIMTSFFDYYKLNNQSDKLDFIYEKYPHISVSTIAYDEEVNYEILYDCPEIDNSKIRVAGPFTVDYISSTQVMVSLQDAMKEDLEEASSEDYNETKEFIEKVLFYLKYDGLSYQEGKKLKLSNVQNYSNGFIYACANLESDPNKKIAISIGPEYGNLDLFQVEQAIYEALRAQFNMLIFLGFGFDEMAQVKIKRNKPKDLEIEMAYINPDIEIDDLQRKPNGAQIFTVFGDPQINLKKNNDNEFIIELDCIEVYDPKTGSLTTVEIDKISAWFIDENFDGNTFIIHQAIFIDSEKYQKQLANELGALLDQSKIKYICGKESLPFKVGDKKQAAIKIVDLRGNEIVTTVNLKSIKE